MRSPTPNLTRFVRRVHLRLILVRAAERGGACVGVASIFACLFAAVALFQQRDAMQLVLPTLAIGAVIGIIWGFSRRPTRFDAVVEADRQLELADLLATAYAQQHSDDPWQRAVVAIADERCRSLSPAAVVVHRYGGRAWGGIGLSAALGLTLALLSGLPQDSRARSRTAEVKRASATIEASDETAETQGMRVTSPMASAPPRSAAGAAESRAGVEAQAEADPNGGATADNVTMLPSSDASGGMRAGQTASSGDAVPRPVGGGQEASADATATAGGGAATAQPPARSDGSPVASAGTTAAGNAKQRTPPWASPSWGSDRAAAGQAVRSGRVPDAYRDVVSEYFRDPAGGENRSVDNPVAR